MNGLSAATILQPRQRRIDPFRGESFHAVWDLFISFETKAHKSSKPSLNRSLGQGGSDEAGDFEEAGFYGIHVTIWLHLNFRHVGGTKTLGLLVTSPIRRAIATVT